MLDRYSDLFLLLALVIYYLNNNDSTLVIVTGFASIGTALIPYARQQTSMGRRMPPPAEPEQAGPHALSYPFPQWLSLGVPVALDFIPWQIRWSRMAREMNDRGYWENVSAFRWMEFLKPAGMEEVKIYPAPSKIVPVEVLLARKTG